MKINENYPPYKHSLETFSFSVILTWVLLIGGALLLTLISYSIKQIWLLVVGLPVSFLAVFIISALAQIVVNLGAIAKEMHIANESKNSNVNND